MSDLGGFSLHELFRGEAESHAAALSAGLVELEGTSDASVVEPLMRAAHSIKGAARVIGLDIAVRLAHAMEDVLVAMQKGREAIAPARVDMLLRGSDLLASLAQVDEAGVPAWTAKNTDAVDALVAALREPAAAPRVESAPAPAPAPVPLPTAPVALAREGTGTAVAAAAAPSVRASAVRVTTEKLDRLLQLAGETMLEAQRLGSIRGEALALKAELVRLEEELDFLRAESRRAGMDPARVSPARDALRRASGGVLAHLRTIEGAIRRSEETSTQLYHEVLSSRMRPFSDATGALPRTVRDLARQLGKEARLEIAGEDVPVDRDILARLDAPLNHLLRNAIDHGVEPPDARRAAGKPAQATLRVEARHHAGMLRIRVCDDGRGVDHEALRAKIVRRGLADEAMARAMDRQELLEFLFLPGFSTASQVTEVSGRGVGLDVVQSTAREVGGVARIDTVPGRGTTFELELPITLSVIRALLVEVAGETLAFPLARIARVVEPAPGEVSPVEGRMQFLLDGAPVGVVDAARILELGEVRRSDGRDHIVVLGGGDDRYGFAVDRLVGEEDLVVRALDPRLGKVPHLSASAVRENGEPVLIVDVEDLLQSLRMALVEGRVRGRGAAAISASAARAARALVVDDSATVREVERQLLVRMGFEVETAVDGMDGWHALREGAFDLVVSDIDMPRMNGIEFVRTLRADPRFAALPVIVVSYKDREEDRLAGLEAGATAYLTKGAFQDSTFADTVREFVDPARLAPGGRIGGAP